MKLSPIDRFFRNLFVAFLWSFVLSVFAMLGLRGIAFACEQPATAAMTFTLAVVAGCILRGAYCWLLEE